ncbi:PREDICTED: uncharacterized protein LOC104743216 [Camelina sativa]|uniref:Uncharacterized protein LOC104743216 n=1 Tax=Camelina sativa TaxID=90675 RepID=A0ABM0VXP1_CAMSA|nr:PREDICTED: uncharacterized protein LOC104743216 [Camelina sativa]
MDIFCRNVRGLNDPVKRRNFRNWLKHHKPLFGGILETHISPDKAQRILSSVASGWSFAANYPFSDLGKIWVLWYPSVQVTILSSSLQMMVWMVQLPFVFEELVVSVVYVSSVCSEERKALWQELQDLSHSHLVLNKPWLVIGDFNQTLYPHEHSVTPTASSSRGMRALSQCLSIAKLSDLPFYGNTFTWSNKQDTRHVAKKLDKILVNDDWFCCFPSSIGVYGEPGFSDHSPCCVFLDTEKPKQRSLFKFLTLLNRNPDFSPLVNLWWNALSFDCSKMLKLSKKLKE